MEPGPLYNRRLFTALRKALLYGFFLAIGVYYLLLYFSVREKAYLYWSLSNIGMLVYRQ